MNTIRLAGRHSIRVLAFAAIMGSAAPLICDAQSALGDKSDESLNTSTSRSAAPMEAQGENGERDLAMPAAQLIQVLRKNMEVMVEVESLIADAAQQKGLSIQADALTDQQVYAQIAGSRELRASVTQFLLARGYISQEEIEAATKRGQQNHNRATLPDDENGDANAFGRRSTTADALDEIGTPPHTREGRQDLPFQPPTQSAGSVGTHEVNITDGPEALHRPAPYSLLSLRDLYTQVPDSPDDLKRFGSDLFLDRTERGIRSPSAGAGNAGSALDVPLGPDYVLGPGDELSITLWGGISQNLSRVVDREGRIALPETGLTEIAGLSMAKAQDLIAETLWGQYRNLHVALTVAQLRSIRIFVVGDVQRPGSYELSALASPMSALFAAGGPTAVGSLRVLRHYRNDKLVGEIDLYDFMLHGVRPSDDRLQGGDTLLVPPVGPQVAISGAVKRPAIYEMKAEKDLGSVLEVAGGFTVAAALTSITIDRVIANQHREQIALPVAAADGPHAIAALLRSADVKDGDRIHIGTVLPRDERAIYVQGHVARPGKIAFRDNMRMSDVLRSYQDLLPEPGQRGEIVRLVAPDLHPETIDFNVFDVLIGNSSIPLQPFDTIKVFGRYERDAPSVSIRGEVQRPGAYPLFQGMTAAQLVRTAGGFKRDALIDQADLASYKVINGTHVSVQRRDVAIGDAVLKGDRNADEPLKPGDVLTIHQLTGWNDIGASIVIEGEVGHPGSYGFQEGEHLSDVLQRAGGFRFTAYPEGAVLTRPEVAALEEKSRQELIRQIETSSAAARVSPTAGSEQAATAQILQRQQDDVLARLRSQPASGRLVIHIDTDIASWAGTAADIEVRSGDLLRIPKRPGFVLVSGQAYSPSALTFIPGKTAGWYLQHAGGATSIANRKEIFIIRANGDVIGRRSGSWYERDVLSTRLNAGDTIVVPQKIVGPSVTWRNLLGTAQIVASLAIAAAVAGL